MNQIVTLPNEIKIILPDNGQITSYQNVTILSDLWFRARVEFLNNVLTLKGANREKLSINTHKMYKVALRQFFDGVLGQQIWPEIFPWQVSTNDAIRWKEILGVVGKIKCSQKDGNQIIERVPMSAASINQKMAALYKFYEFVQDVYDISYGPELQPIIDAGLLYLQRRNKVLLWPSDLRNPFNPKTTGRDKINKYERATYPTPLELKSILNDIDTKTTVGKFEYALLYTLGTTCRRSSEILNIKWGDIKPGDNGGYIFHYRYKGGDKKFDVLDDLAYSAIRDYLKSSGRLDNINDDEYIFISPDQLMAKNFDKSYFGENKPVHNSTANAILRRRAKNVGINKEKAHIHGLRHAGARLRLQQMKERGNVDYQILMEKLGHTSLATTLIYVKTTLEDPEDEGLKDAAVFLKKD